MSSNPIQSEETKEVKVNVNINAHNENENLNENVNNNSNEEKDKVKKPCKTNELKEETKESQVNEPMNQQYDHDAAIAEAVQFQVGYHFTDDNLRMDNYLLSRMHEDANYWVPLATVCGLTKIRSLTDDPMVVLNAIKHCDNVVLNDDETKVKRPNFIPPKPKQHKDLRRTVFLYGLPPDVTKERVADICCEYGKIKSVRLDSCKKIDTGKANNQRIANFDGEAPDREVAIYVMSRKFGPRVHIPRISGTPVISATMSAPTVPAVSPMDSPLTVDTNVISQAIIGTPTLTMNEMHSPHTPLCHPLANPNNPMDFSHLHSAFVVFESQSQANKCVKGRMRARDGIRAMHQYDFMKQCKKVVSSKARGLSPLFSPITSTLSQGANKFTFELSPQSHGNSKAYRHPRTATHYPRASMNKQSNRRFPESSRSHARGNFNARGKNKHQNNQKDRPSFHQRRASAPMEHSNRRWSQFKSSNSSKRHYNNNNNNSRRAQTTRNNGRYRYSERHSHPVSGRQEWPQTQTMANNQRWAQGPDGSRGFAWSRNPTYNPNINPSGQIPPVPTPQWMLPQLQYTMNVQSLIQQGWTPPSTTQIYPQSLIVSIKNKEAIESSVSIRSPNTTDVM